MTQQQPTQEAKQARTAKSSPLLFQAGVFILIVAVTLILFNSWQIWNAHQRDLRSAEHESANLARSLAQHADDTFMQVDGNLLDLTERIQTDGLGQPQLLRLQRVMQAQVGNLPQLHGMFIYDSHGRWLATSSGKFVANANNADREYFKYHQDADGKGLYIGKVIRSRSTGDLIIPISRRFNYPDGSFAGVVLATLYVDYFRQFYDSFALNTDASLSLLLADGTILYRRPYVAASIGKNISQGVLFREILPHSEFGNATITSLYDKVERIYGYSRVNRYPLVIAAGMSKRDALADWRDDASLFAVGGLSLLVILLALGLVLLRQIKHSVQTEAELVRTRDQLTTINQMLEELALLDGLTGLANRRQFDIALKNELTRASRNYRSVALLMLDIDYFKQYNDIYGHVAGDQCLQQIGQTLKGLARRSNDIMARYGGEELGIILPDTDAQGALIFAERVINAVRELKIPHQGNPHGIVTISIGICAKVPHMYNDTPIGFINEADNALYLAKKEGKNRIACENCTLPPAGETP
ncbi:sensor domain-containing diguanylate cyclase [Serratia ficaria]|uniref:diguanylate cyclase n=1 Tax=Serratia ficaria TaxID=61651 RepID=A0A240C709_SERFI|nr:sensor domain-containing diguanylate cyclase [Serratia ficaria]REF44112.1 diguanylate cyclase (GGDEF)-like protein [Serratia ficaria]CAI0740266.1 Bacteriophytochrome cph2 [Serratia ficaria]CAI0744411.1 Bacteriophytochrome cph2 [Serratia ficaria]CAI0760359.1 Bacteriophytochrome cph2 [Serratia ficaria]CAI0771917.1 Bacteriophytochrome cph2 [Serratia ficaria]